MLRMLFVLVLLILPAPAEAAGVRTEMLVPTEWLAARIGDTKMRILHVAPNRDGYDAGHIPDAFYLAWSTVAVERGGIANEFPDVAEMADAFAALDLGTARRIVVYDEGKGVLAARTFLALELVGLGDRVSLLDGQLAKWKDEKRPLSFEDPPAKATAFEVGPPPPVIVQLEEIERLYGGSSTPPDAPKLLDARPDSHYTGEEPGPDIPRGGHIPGAVSVFWQRHLKADSAEFLPPEEILALYKGLGIGPEDRVITYCRTGAQASQTYFTLRYLGFDVRLYDGSLIEWTKEDSRPVKAGPEPR